MMGELRRHGRAISAGAFYPRLRKMDEAVQLQGAARIVEDRQRTARPRVAVAHRHARAERHSFRPNDSCAHGLGCGHCCVRVGAPGSCDHSYRSFPTAPPYRSLLSEGLIKHLY